MTATAAITVNSEDKLCISGEVNFATVNYLWEQSLPLIKNFTDLYFDFSQVTHANSAALALLVEWMKYAKRHQKTLSFQKLPEQLASIAQIAGVRLMF